MTATFVYILLPSYSITFLIPEQSNIVDNAEYLAKWLTDLKLFALSVQFFCFLGKCWISLMEISNDTSSYIWLYIYSTSNSYSRSSLMNRLAQLKLTDNWAPQMVVIKAILKSHKESLDKHKIIRSAQDSQVASTKLAWHWWHTGIEDTSSDKASKGLVLVFCREISPCTESIYLFLSTVLLHSCC